MDANFVPPARPTTPRTVQWSNDQWEEQSHWEQAQWIKSPRRRQSPRQRSKKGKQGPHAKGKGKQKHADDQVQYGPQSLPAMPSLEPPWMTASTAAPSMSLGPFSSQMSETKDDKDKDKQLRSLVAALRKHQDALPDDVQALMKDVSIRAGQQETKQLHAAVSQHGRAKREIADAQAARLNMHVAWKNFLSQSVQQWTAYTNQFMSQEKQLMDRLQAAQENLAVAKENLSSSQLAAGVVPKEDAAMASDTEDIPAKAHDSAAGEKIAASFQDLANNLRALHTQAVQAVQQEVDQQDRKRPRTESPNSKEKEKETPPNPGFGEGE